MAVSGKTFPDAENREPLIVHSLIREEVIERGTRSNAFAKQPMDFIKIRCFITQIVHISSEDILDTCETASAI